MAEYTSSHSGANIDSAVTSVLNGTCGIQGVKVFGNELTPDSDNKVNIGWQNLVVHEGYFTPILLGALEGQAPDQEHSPTCTYAHQSGYFIKFGELCYINLRIKCFISSVFSGATTYAVIGGLNFFDTYGFLPRNDLGVFEYPLATSEITINNGGGTMPNQRTLVSYMQTKDSDPIPHEILDGGATTHMLPGSKFVSLEYGNGLHALVLGTVINNGTSPGFWVSCSGIFPTMPTVDA